MNFKTPGVGCLTNFGYLPWPAQKLIAEIRSEFPNLHIWSNTLEFLIAENRVKIHELYNGSEYAKILTRRIR